MQLQLFDALLRAVGETDVMTGAVIAAMAVTADIAAETMDQSNAGIGILPFVCLVRVS